MPLPEPFDDPWAEEANAYRVGFAADLKWANAPLAAGRFDEAIAILERLRDRHPRDVSVPSNLGAAYLDSGRVDEGREALGAALEVEPDHFSTHLNLSALEERSGDLPAALEHADAAIRGNPYLAAAHEKRGLLLARCRRFDEARRALEDRRRAGRGAGDVLDGIGAGPRSAATLGRGRHGPRGGGAPVAG